MSENTELLPVPQFGAVEINSDFIIKRTELLEAAARLQARGVSNQEEAAECAKIAKEIGRLAKRADEMRKDLQRPFSDFVAEIRAKLTKEIEPLNTAKKTVMAPADAWLREQRAKEEAERRRQIEEDRLAQEEIERQRQEQELFGQSLEPTRPLPPAPVAPVTTTTVEGMSVVESIDWELHDRAQIPQSWLMIDKDAVKTSLKANRTELLAAINASPQGAVIFHGLKLTKKTSTRTR